ncbi:MAG: phosphate ABC transporter permease subunit PstC [Planctomycetales bacterium]|nr:phosphate ABC transporter permease subunit PstC [Planctomycetales bacterium]
MSAHESTIDLSQRPARFRPSKGGYLRETLVKTLLAMCSALSILTTLGIIYVLAHEGSAFFQAEGVSFWGFISEVRWNPLIGSEKHFGVWALISGTMLVSLIAMAIAIPLGLLTAVYLSEYARPRVRAIVKPALDVLAGIPTVVYGFFALTMITPALKLLHDGFNTYNAMSAGIAVGILCLPIVSSLVEDALQAVPRSLREGAFGLGATKFEVSVKIVLPAALSGIISAVLLAIARAIGETMVVALAAGSRPQFTLDPRQDIQTMTGWMVQMALGDVSNFSIEYLSLYAVAGVLFVITLMLTIVGNLTKNRFREVYAES